MRQLVGFLGSLAVGLLMAAAGLYFDVKTLTIAGAILFAFAAILWLFEWGRTAPKKPAFATLTPPKPPAQTSRRPSVVYNVRSAVYDARRAMADNKNDRTAEKVLPKVKAATLTLNKEFGVNFPPATGEPQLDLEMFCRIIEEMVPYIAASHDEAAREVGEEWIRRIADNRG